MAPGADAARAAAPPADLRVAAVALFGDRLPLAQRYARALVTTGVERGLIGPREAPRIWDRHLLNCAAVAELVPRGARVIDVGSGAGLPGLVLAVARPDLSVVLLEPMLRRTTFLTEIVDELGVADRVQVQRGRAEELVGRLPEADVVTARALAPLDRLARWCLPLTRVGGHVLALKGSTASDEVAEHGAVVQTHGGGAPVIHHCGSDLLDPPTVVVSIRRERRVVGGRSGRRSGQRG